MRNFTFLRISKSIFYHKEHEEEHKEHKELATFVFFVNFFVSLW